MKYTSWNHLEDFEFHDTVLLFESYRDNTLIVTAKHLNIHKDAKQNANDYDMEIASAIISFECFKVHSLEPLRAYQYDADGNLYTNEPQILYHGQDAEEFLIRELKSSVSLNGLSIQSEGNRTTIEPETNSGSVFFAVCSCTNVMAAWDEYCGKAWYEEIRR